MDILKAARGLSRENWYRIYRVQRQHGGRINTYTPEQERHCLQMELDENSFIRNGRRVVAVSVWSRDCDMVEGTSLSYVLAHHAAYEKWANHEYEWAEGPMSFTILTPEEAGQFEPVFRDRIGEAWDNGNVNAYYV